MSLLRILNVLWISVWVLSLSDGYSLRYVHRTRPIASSLATKQHITANHVHKSQYTSQHTIRLHGSSTDGDEDEILQPKVQGMKGYYGKCHSHSFLLLPFITT